MFQQVFKQIRDMGAVNDISLNNKTFKLMLLKGSATINGDESLYTDITSQETSGTNYIAGGNVITNTMFQEINTNENGLKGDDVVFSNVTIDVSGGVIYIDDPDDNLKYLVAYFILDSTLNLNNEDLTIQWYDDGNGNKWILDFIRQS